MDESSFTGEVEPCSKTDSPLGGGGDLSTLSNVVFMGTLVQCGKGQVNRAPGSWGPASYSSRSCVTPPSLLHTGSCDRNRGAVSVWRSFQDDAGGRGEGCGASGLWECRGYGAARIRDLRNCGEAEEEGSKAEGGQTQLPTDLF